MVDSYGNNVDLTGDEAGRLVNSTGEIVTENNFESINKSNSKMFGAGWKIPIPRNNSSGTLYAQIGEVKITKQWRSTTFIGNLLQNVSDHDGGDVYLTDFVLRIFSDGSMDNAVKAFMQIRKWSSNGYTPIGYKIVEDTSALKHVEIWAKTTASWNYLQGNITFIDTNHAYEAEIILFDTITTTETDPTNIIWAT
jgi:hypothetical protein